MRYIALCKGRRIIVDAPTRLKARQEAQKRFNDKSMWNIILTPEPKDVLDETHKHPRQN